MALVNRRADFDEIGRPELFTQLLSKKSSGGAKMSNIIAICGNCGELPYVESYEFKYCPTCREELEKKMQCPGCGKEGTEDEVFGHKCPVYDDEG